MVSLNKDTYKQPKEKQEDEFGDLDRGIGIHEDKDWAGKLLGQPILICTYFLWVHLWKCLWSAVLQ